ncbi:MAG: TatD family nuclease-associated radical SAM protein [Elusimicrobiota bacterium]
MSIVYQYKKDLYVNLTNRCTADCVFCIKRKWDYQYRGHNLRLQNEPTAEEIIRAIGDPAKYKEIVFCGYGEPFLRLTVLLKVSRRLKKEAAKIRINTNGHGNLIAGKNILPKLAGLVDEISVSLNAGNTDDYMRICRPKWGKKTFPAIIDFIRQAKKFTPKVSITAVNLPGLTTAEDCRKLAKKLGVTFRSRPYLM